MAKRICVKNASTTRPTSYSSEIGNPQGYFIEPDYGTNPPTPATVVDADWANSMQEEVCQTVEMFGGTCTPVGTLDPATAQLPGLLYGVLRGESALPGAAIAYSKAYPSLLAVSPSATAWLPVAMTDSPILTPPNVLFKHDSGADTSALIIPLPDLPVGSYLTSVSVFFAILDATTESVIDGNLILNSSTSIYASAYKTATVTLDPTLSPPVTHAPLVFTLTSPLLIEANTMMQISVAVSTLGTSAKIYYIGTVVNLTRTKLAP